MRNIICFILICFTAFFTASCGRDKTPKAETAPGITAQEIKDGADAETSKPRAQQTDRSDAAENADPQMPDAAETDIKDAAEGEKTGRDNKKIEKTAKLEPKNAPEIKDIPKNDRELGIIAENAPEAVRETPEKKAPENNIKTVLRTLKNTDHFSRHTAEHIFNGSVNRKNQATGYHYDPIPDSDGKIVAGTKGKPNKFGVYEARVTVRGIKKHRTSSFFPDEMTPQEIVDAINNAYIHRKPTANHDDAYYGYTKKGMCIQMFINDYDDRITSAFPKYQNSKCAEY